LFLVIAGVTQPLFGQLLHTAVCHAEQNYLEVTLLADGADTEALQENLDGGMTARVEFAIRISRPRHGVWTVFGDRGLREYVTGSEIHWDVFTERYVIEADDGGRFSFRDMGEATQFLFSLRQYRIPWTGMVDRRGTIADEFVVDTQVRYSPIVYVPALAILSFFNSGERLISPWLRTGPLGAPR
jgi:hypothetical protein